MNVTDKELLTFCDFSNIKIEYANLKNEKISKEGSIEKDHTIYTLLKKEYDGIDTRRNLIDNEASYSEIAINSETDEALGAIYITDRNKIKRYTYYRKENLRADAPIVTEYFERYNNSGNNAGHEGHFLDEWDIIYAYDSYNLGLDEIASLKSVLSEQEYDKIDIPSRDIVSAKEMGIKVIELTIIVLDESLDIANIFGKGLKAITPSKILEKCKISVGDIAAPIIDATIGKDASSVVTGSLNMTGDIIKKPLYEKGALKINLMDTGSRFIVLKKGDSYVITIGNSSELSDYDLGEYIPNIFFEIHEKISNLLLKDEIKKENVLLTGCGQAGLLAQILGSALNINYKIFATHLELDQSKLKATDFKTLDTNMGSLTSYEVLNSTMKSGAIYFAGVFYALYMATIGGTALSGGWIVGTFIGAGVLIKQMYTDFLDVKKNNALIKFLKDMGIFSEKVTIDLNKKYNINLIPECSDYNLEVDLYVFIQTYFNINYFDYSLHYVSEDGKIIIFWKESGLTGAEKYKKITLSNNIYEVSEISIYNRYSNKTSGYRLLTSFSDKWTNSNESDDYISFALIKLLMIKSDIVTYYKALEINNWKTSIVKNIENNSENITQNSLLYYFDDIDSVEEIKEYTFFPFLSKNGNLEKDLREEYKKSVVRSLMTGFSNSAKYSDWNTSPKENLSIEENSYNPKKYKIIDTYEDDILLELRKSSSDLKKYPHINKIYTETTKENIKDYYSKLDEEDSNTELFAVGIVDNKGNYLDDEIGFVYNNDFIIGRELEVKLLKRTPETLEEYGKPSTSPISDGMSLLCSCGSKETKLKVTSQNHFKMKGKLTATEKDCNPNENILPFGNCMISYPFPPCSLGLTKKWENTSKIFKVNGGKVLLNTSSMKCSKGGEIKCLSKVSNWNMK